MSSSSAVTRSRTEEWDATTQSAVAHLEGGHVSPSLPTLDKLADALGVELVVGFVDLDDRIAG